MGFLSALVSHVATVVAFAPLIYLIFCLVYNYFLHPLRDYPGPLFWRISPFPRAWAQCRGTLVFDVARFQRRYGPVLRIGPSELAFVSDEAWKNIYGHRGVGEEENPKDLRFYRLSNHIPHSILSAGRAEHGLLRRQLASGFSERSLRGQEDIIGGYVDLLVRRLRENSDNGKTALNMREWYNWTTFDIIGNLGFGSDFQCLEKTTYSPWIRVITDSIKQGAWLQAIAYTGLEGVARWIISLAMASFQGHQTLSRNKVEQRIQLGKQGERLDFLDGLIKQVRVSFTKADQSTSMTADEDR
ncbi:putative cytochrome p450 protein [Eutypa lata UCREL1]|uniref:Putative cytochrome p450 protein n=1 Tax=Eutypa lata (strain UCR-EL1) TaxID=1287681 RepID=M7T8H9_EUTLA|nr:putative cytochrome p450 protein [Eutypa lata UCREL1]